MKKRKICFIITSLIHYSRNFLILDELKKREDVDLHIILGGIALSPKYASSSFNVKKILEDEGHENIYEIHFNLDGDSQIAKAKTVGLGVVEFSSIFNFIQPDLIILRGDRFEVLSAALASAHLNIPIAHIEGGDVSGTLDESVRHAITKLAHIHFATNEPAYQRILRMGEKKEYVFNFGSPDVEVAKKILECNPSMKEINFSDIGSGASFDYEKDFIMVMFHPVNNETKLLPKYTRELLEAVHELGMQTIWFWPNFDAGAEQISHELRMFKDKVSNHQIKYLRYLPPREFLTLLVNTKCLVGNSSSGIKECSYLGVPVVNVGNRQNNRLCAENIFNCDFDRKEIIDAIKKQTEKGRYDSSNLYFSNDTSREISEIVATIDLYTQKSFVD